MQLGEILSLKFPGVDLLNQVKLRSENGKVEIRGWDYSLGPFPTAEILAQWELEVQPIYDEKQFKIRNRIILDQLDLLDLKTIRALRTKDDQRIIDLEVQAQELRKQLK